MQLFRQSETIIKSFFSIIFLPNFYAIDCFRFH